jgi:hypothetical protein
MLTPEGFILGVLMPASVMGGSGVLTSEGFVPSVLISVSVMDSSGVPVPEGSVENVVFEPWMLFEVVTSVPFYMR